MSTTLKFRDEVDLPEWRVLSQPVYAGTLSIAASGTWFAEDLRNNNYAHPEVLFNPSLAILGAYNKKGDGFKEINGSFGAAGSFGSGATAVFVPSFSPKGLLANSGNTTTKITLSTALPVAVVANQLANRGDGVGFIIRVIGSGVGGSGKTEERRVIANTSGTTPTLILNEPLSFTPNNTNSDSYEFLSGSYITLNTGALVANQFRRYDCLTSSYSSLSTTNLIATVPSTSNLLIALDEGYVPSDRNVGEGYLVGASTYDATNTLTGGLKYCLLATGSAAGALTGQSTLGDAGVLANQFRNYQIRIIEDTAIPTAVGQRRRIASHTAGASPDYTLQSNWTVTPSATCKYVIENWTENVIAMIGGTTTMYNYTHSNHTGGTADTWSTAIWAAKPNSLQVTGAFGVHAFGLPPNEINSNKASNIHLFRGGSTTFDTFDIAGGAAGVWTAGNTPIDWTGVTYDVIQANDIQSVAYNPHTQGGRYLYLFPGCGNSTITTQRSAIRFDTSSFKVEKIAGMKAVSGITGLNQRSAWVSVFQENRTKVAFWNTNRPLSGADFWQLMLTR